MLTDWLVDDSTGSDGDSHYVRRTRSRRRSGLAMLERLRHELSRRRDNGEQLDQAWERSVTVAMRGIPYSGEPRAQWRWALNETVEAWRDAYECRHDETVDRVAALEVMVA